MRLLSLLFCLISLTALAQDGPIKVYLQSGKVISTQYAYLYSGTDSFLRIHERRGEKISINLVHHIEGTDQKGNYRFFKPIEPSFNRKVWAERSYTSERIVIYNTDIAPGAMYAGYKPKNCFYTKDNGPLLPLKLKTLKRDLGDSEASLDYLKKGKNIGAAQMGFRAASLSLIIAGIVSFANDSSTDNQNMDAGPSVPPAIIAGVVCAWIPVFMESGKKQRYVEALKAYK